MSPSSPATATNITVQQVSFDFVKDANIANSEALAKLIKDNLTNAKLYEEKAIVFDKLGPDRAEEAKAIIDAFSHSGGGK